MTSPVTDVIHHDGAGCGRPSRRSAAHHFGTLLESQLAASSTPFAPHPVAAPERSGSDNSTQTPASRLERSNPRQGGRRQRR